MSRPRIPVPPPVGPATPVHLAAVDGTRAKKAGRRDTCAAALAPMNSSSPSPWYVWFPSWLSGLSGPVAIGAAIIAYRTWHRSGFTTQNRASIDQRRRAIRVEIANTGRMEAAVDDIRLSMPPQGQTVPVPVMSPPPPAASQPEDLAEGIYVLELEQPLADWVPRPLPPGRTLDLTLTAGLPSAGAGGPVPDLPPLPANVMQYRVGVFFGNGTRDDLRIVPSGLGAFVAATTGVLATPEAAVPPDAH